MKTKAFTVLTSIVLLFTTTTFAGNDNPEKKFSSAVASYLKANLKYPETPFGDKTDCCVWVEVTVIDDGSLKVTGYNGNENIKNSIISGIENLTSNDKAFKNFAHEKATLKIKFHLK